MARRWDAVVIGAGPNGLAAAVLLAQHGVETLVLEAKPTVGGGARSAALTLPGFVHDVCSAIHPTAVVSPFLRTLPLDRFGLAWEHPRVPLAHPLGGGRAAVLHRSLDDTAAALGADGDAWRALFAPFLAAGLGLFDDLLAPLRIPDHPFALARFGLSALRSAEGLAGRFRGEEARALFAGCAAHSFLPLDAPVTAAVGLVLVLAGHAIGWPVARGGSQKVVDALAKYFVSLGGTIETGRRVASLDDLPPARALLFDVTPKQLLAIASARLSADYRDEIAAYRYGPGVFKVDWALEGPIPWLAEACEGAGTVHLGGTLEEVAAGEAAVTRGEHPERPFVLVGQQSVCDRSRAPRGKHTGWAYCHVPNGSTVDMTDRIELQLERFAPGFRERILARATHASADMERYNENYVGGDINGGLADVAQLFTRPAVRLVPYSTPDPGIYICSSSTPPGGGVHGMCGYWAARAALKRVFSIDAKR